MKALAIVALLALAPSLHAQWRAPDYALASSATIGLAGDCGSTIAALRRGAVERNPLLTTRPGALGIVSACALTWAATMLIADELPRRYRRPLLALVTISGIFFTIRNSRRA